MAKFVTVQEAPTDLQSGDYVIQAPNFLAEIAQQKGKAPKTGLAARFHLRLLVDTIGQNYDPEGLTGWVIKTHLYEGRPVQNDGDLNAILLEALQTSYPQIFNKYLEQKVKARPSSTSTVYLVESPLYNDPAALLQGYGLVELQDEQELKPRRSVGKPAVTKEQAEQLKKQ